MDLNSEQQEIGIAQSDTEIKSQKRKIDEVTLDSYNLIKSNKISKINSESKQNDQNTSEKSEHKEGRISKTQTKVPVSPKKRLDFAKLTLNVKSDKEKYIYGNYSQYYGYRNEGKDCRDKRLDIFEEYRDTFKNKHVLDIGCNSGLITMEVAKQYDVQSVVGLDIDKTLVNQAIRTLTRHKKSFPMDNELKRLRKFPFNITFVHGNYVLKDDVLLEIERAQFDVILCLSITKWIHLNFGDKGLKQAFKRIFLQLKPGGKLILEAQPFESYSRRKKMTDTIYKNYKDIKLLPTDFIPYLLSTEVGFSKVELMGVPDHCSKGFKRPIHIFCKQTKNV